MKKVFILGLITSLFFVSCDNTQEDVMLSPIGKSSLGKSAIAPVNLSVVKDMPAELTRDLVVDLEKVVDPSPCGPTIFDEVINESIASNLDALGIEWYGLYAEMNFYYTITDESKAYFGNKGQYTQYVVNRTRSLEKFWEMYGEVSVRGQHNNTLNDKDKIVQTLTFWYGLPQNDAEFYADYFVDYINPTSTFLTETSLLSFDGFAIALDGYLDQGDLIVIGDGIIELLSETGIEDKIVWSGILAHEWAHQIQFNNSDWHPADEIVRTTELEADFMASYYMTHKRGATYNWKRVEAFLELFFNIGDCGFANAGHHGTPLQRMEASRFGYQLAQKRFPRGKILSKNEVHEAFLAVVDDIIGDSSGDL